MSNPSPPSDDFRAPGRDPRPRPSDTAAASDSAGELRPAVAAGRPAGGWGLIAGGAVLLGLVTFFVLSSHRAPAPTTANTLADIRPGSPVVAAPPPPSELATVEAAGRAPAYLPPAQAVLVPAQPPPPPAVVTTVAAARPMPAAGFTVDKAALARKAPTLVVDLAEPPPPAGAARTTAPGATTLAGTPAPTGSNAGGVSSEEQFAKRVGDAEPERSRATLLGNAKATIPQGAMIPGVLETALDSDLPGFARAVVSRDVRGFDGSTVLIPRGSRVIGQYKSAVAQGQSRAFVIWTRIIRPDGATIQIGSPGTDPLGRAGLNGKVDRHFFERFGGSILLSVLNAGVSSLAKAPSTQVVIGSSAEATSLGAQALQPTSISPTIKVAQGAAIRIFVARDLDFSSVGGQ